MCVLFVKNENTMFKNVLTVEEAFNLALIDSAPALELKKQIKEEMRNAQIGNSKHP
jgi:hypothetical protein